MAENIQGNPINVNVPANVTITQGKTNLSTFKKQLQDAEKEMGRALTSVEKGELKSKIIAQAHAQRQLLGLSLYGNASSYSMKKFANAPNPSTVKEYMSDLAKPKSVIGARGGGLDKEIMEREREISFILKSLKMPLPKGTTGIAAQQQAEVKNMARIFNKVKKDDALELDVQKFYQSLTNLKALYERDLTGGGMSKKSYLGRMKELENLSTKFEARAKVSRHDMEPLSAIGKTLVKQPILNAAKNLQAVNKTMNATQFFALGSTPQAIARQAAADSARNEALGIKTVKTAAKKLQEVQKKLLGASFGGEGAPYETAGHEIDTKAFRAYKQQEMVSRMRKALELRMYRELKKSGITELTTAGGGGGSTPIDLNPPGAGGAGGGGFGGFIAKAGAEAIDSLKYKLIEFAGFAAGALGKAVSFPLTFAFGQVKSSIQDAFKEGPELMADMARMAVPLAMKTGDWGASLEKIQGVITNIAGKTVILPNEVTKLAFSYTRVTKDVKGLEEYLKKISLLHSFTEESLQNIDDLVLEWAQAFNIDIPTGAAKIAENLLTVTALTDVSLQEMRAIASWLTPIFAQQANSAKALNEEIMLSGLLAQRGSKLPIMIRGIQGSISQLQTPTNKMLGLFASMGLEIYKMKDGTQGWTNTYKAAGTRLKELYKAQDALNKSAAGGASGPDWEEQHKANTEAIKKEEEYLASMFETWQDGGLVINDTLDSLSELAKLMDNPGTQARFLKELKGSSRDAFLQLLQVVKEAKAGMSIIEKQGGATSAAIEQVLSTTSFYQEQRFNSAKKTFFELAYKSFGEPLRLPYFKGLADLFTRFIENPETKASLEKFGKVLGVLGEKYIPPAFSTFGDLITTIFMGGPDSEAKINEYSEKLKGLITGFLSRLAPIASQIISPIGKLAGNLFMLGFISVLNSDFLKQLSGALGEAIKGAVIGMYGQAGPVGKYLLRGIFPQAGKKEELQDQLNSASGGKSKELWAKYQAGYKPGLMDQWNIADSFQVFKKMEQAGFTFNEMTGQIEYTNSALNDLQAALRSQIYTLNNAPMDWLITQADIEKEHRDRAGNIFNGIKEQMAAGPDEKLEFGSAKWREIFLQQTEDGKKSYLILQEAAAKSKEASDLLCSVAEGIQATSKGVVNKLSKISPAPSGNQL